MFLFLHIAQRRKTFKNGGFLFTPETDINFVILERTANILLYYNYSYICLGLLSNSIVTRFPVVIISFLKDRNDFLLKSCFDIFNIK